jgi:putative transposase
MPRAARLDALGALHHILARGIERRRIFTDDDERQEFLDRMAPLVASPEQLTAPEEPLGGRPLLPATSQ